MPLTYTGVRVKVPNLQWEMENEDRASARVPNGECRVWRTYEAGLLRTWHAQAEVWSSVDPGDYWEETSRNWVSLDLAQDEAEKMLSELLELHGLAPSIALTTKSRFDLIDDEEPVSRPTTPVPRPTQTVPVPAPALVEPPQESPGIVPGAVVVLRSGGPTMTVERRDGDAIHCVWFVAGAPMEHDFLAVTLDLHNPTQMQTAYNPYLDSLQTPGPLPALPDVPSDYP